MLLERSTPSPRGSRGWINTPRQRGVRLLSFRLGLCIQKLCQQLDDTCSGAGAPERWLFVAILFYGPKWTMQYGAAATPFAPPMAYVDLNQNLRPSSMTPDATTVLFGLFGVPAGHAWVNESA
jgi:hypothetical protein